MNKRFSRTVYLNIALSLSVIFSTQALAVEDGGANSEEPTTQELKNSRDRGLMIDPIRKVRKDIKTEESSKTKPAKSVKKPASGKKKATLPKKEKTTVKAHKSPRASAGATTKKASVKKNSLKSAKVPKSVSPALFVNSGNVVAASLNKGGKVPRYKDGENLQVTVRAYEDCNLMIFNYDGKRLTQIFPNEYQQDSFVKAGSRVNIGGTESRFEFCACNDGDKTSSEKIFVYAYPTKEHKQPISIAMNKLPSSPFRSTEMSLEEYRKLVNSSKTFFDRSVKVVPKKQVEKASYEKVSTSDAPNKLELSLMVDGK